MHLIANLFELYETRGRTRYLRAGVSHRDHALQAAAMAERDGAPVPLVLAALLHDVGLLLDGCAEDLAALGQDRRHEETGGAFLARWLGPAVAEPVRLHVRAKRYLCAVDPGYVQRFSSPELCRLMAQGGPLNAREVRAFEEHPYHRDALRLRRIDDRAREPGRGVPELEDFREYLEAAIPAIPAAAT